MTQSISTTLEINSGFTGYHCWPEAPESVAFLRSLHRHVFPVRAFFRVTHENRELEFFHLQTILTKVCVEELLPKLSADPSMSCEQMAFFILNFLNECLHLPVTAVRVAEDDENAATVSYV